MFLCGQIFVFDIKAPCRISDHAKSIILISNSLWDNWPEYHVILWTNVYIAWYIGWVLWKIYDLLMHPDFYTSVTMHRSYIYFLLWLFIHVQEGHPNIWFHLTIKIWSHDCFIFMRNFIPGKLIIILKQASYCYMHYSIMPTALTCDKKFSWYNVKSLRSNDKWRIHASIIRAIFSLDNGFLPFWCQANMMVLCSLEH